METTIYRIMKLREKRSHGGDAGAADTNSLIQGSSQTHEHTLSSGNGIKPYGVSEKLMQKASN